MNHSPSITAIAKGITEAQKAIGAAVKGSKNPFFRSTYADLGSVMEACKEHLMAQEIAVLQPVGRDELGEYVETMLLHSSGEFMSDKMSLNCARKMISPREDKGEKFEPYLENDPQAQGSAITYARRYGLQSMLFIPAEDDDAEGAMNRVPTAVAKERAAVVRQQGEPDEIRQPATFRTPQQQPSGAADQDGDFIKF